MKEYEGSSSPGILLGSSTGNGGNVECGRGSPDSAASRHSVTVIHRETLPSYSCERFYLLSELQLKSHSAYLLEHETYNPDEDDGATQSTVPEDDESTINDSVYHHPSGDKMSSMVLLYFLWKPTMTQDPNEFIESYILPRMKQLESMRSIVSSMPTSEIRQNLHTAGAPNHPAIKNEGSESTNTFSTNNESNHELTKCSSSDEQVPSDGIKPNISIYLVIERAAPVDSKSLDLTDSLETTRIISGLQRKEEETIEELARKVAKHDELRFLCEGVTIGLSNHERAAPALEACVDAVSFGGKERRQSVASHKLLTEKDSKSVLGIVTDESDDLLGIQNDGETDAVDGVAQVRISAEWNGQGNMRTFAERAQKCWRRRHGLADIPDLSPRKAAARKRRRPMGYTMDEIDEYLINGMALALILGYVFFHLRNDFPTFLNPENWDEWIQRLRSF